MGGHRSFTPGVVPKYRPPNPGPPYSVGAVGSVGLLLPSGPYMVGPTVGLGKCAFGLGRCGAPRGSALLEAVQSRNRVGCSYTR